MKVKAIERNVAFNKDAKEPKWAYVMQPEYYGQLDVDKVVEQAAQASGLAKGVLLASLSAYGSVVKTWATEGHTIPIPGLGSMRFGLRSTAVDDVTKVSASLITSRRVIFIPNTDIKQALANTGISITCYDHTGKVVKTVTSKDKNDAEDNEGDNTQNGGGTDAYLTKEILHTTIDAQGGTDCREHRDGNLEDYFPRFLSYYHS